MSDIAADYELQADRLRRLLKAKKTFEPAMELALVLPAVTHTGGVRKQQPRVLRLCAGGAGRRGLQCDAD